jgi:hypothetical protein
MTTWVIRSETSDLDRATELATDQRNRGYRVWIEDENGRQVDERPLKNVQASRSLRQYWIAPVFVLVPIMVLIGGLYLLGVWVDGVW